MSHEFKSQDTREPDLAEFATRLQQVREEERAHLARELHDELGAILMAAKLDVACLKTRLTDLSFENGRRLVHLEETLSLGIALKCRIVEGHCPSSLSNLGLVASLEILRRDFALTSGIEINSDLEEVALDEWTQLAVYRLIQEGLTNIAKYASATRVHIVLANRNGKTVVAVTDDGVGFDFAAMKPSHHGLRGIRHRVETCGGRLKVTSVPGEGTRLVAFLPARYTAAEEAGWSLGLGSSAATARVDVDRAEAETGRPGGRAVFGVRSSNARTAAFVRLRRRALAPGLEAP